MDKILIFDFGGQYCHLIARRISDFGVQTEIVPSDCTAEKVRKDKDVRGVILSGGARSVYEKNAPKFDKEVLNLPVPVLGICYGHQLIAHKLGGKVVSGKAGEYGLTELAVVKGTGIFSGLGEKEKVWMNHRDNVVRLPDSFLSIGRTARSRNAAFTRKDGKISGVQFHPEVTHTLSGAKILRNFVFKVCRCRRSRTAMTIAEELIKEARETIGGAKAIIGLSGGVDSAVAAEIVGKAIGKNLIAVFVDTGLMRYDDARRIKKIFRKKINLKVIDASRRFFKSLKGVAAPERKRKIIGRLFTDVFSEVAKKEKAYFLVQGTIYSDRIESCATKHSSTIKSHHNVGGLPRDLKLKVYEPLRDLYKDEVRRVAKTFAMSDEMICRQVFPGPGFAIRIIGEVTPEKAKIISDASKIIEEELKKTEFWKKIWMSFPVLLPIKSVGVQGDERSYKYPIVLRVVESKDAMTANFSKIPHEILEKISTRITNEIREVNRVVYDITNKPPATMEWE